MATDKEKLTFNLQERQYPYFEDSELDLLLVMYVDVWNASYQGCMLKANADDALTLGPIKTASNRAYWLQLAEQYRSQTFKTADAEEDTSGGYYNTTMNRVDDLV